jgi:hypothetical protein
VKREVVALADQLGGRPLGFLNNRLYELGKHLSLASVTHDITVGNNNSFAGVVGFSAAAGWDLTTGWGTAKDGLVPLLLSMGDDEDDDTDR